MLDVRGFVTPEQDFGGLDKLTNTVRYQQQRDEEQQRREGVRKAGNAAFLQGLLDPKDFLTGTKLDPNITKGVSDILETGMQLSQTEGMDNATLQMALMPKYRQLSEYSQKAKTIRADVEEQLKNMPKGYNKQALLDEAMKAAFVGEDGEVYSMDKISQIDPSKNYIQEAIIRNPLGVTTTEIYGEAIKDFEPVSEKRSVKRQSASGAMQKRASLLKSRGVFDYDEDAQQWVPKYEIARDGDKPQMGTFTNAEGKQVKAPIRMVTKDVFNRMMSSYPAIADRIKGEIRQINPDINMDSQEAMRLGQMLMYEELKPLAAGSIEDAQETKAAPAPRITVNVGGGGNQQNTASQGNEFDRFSFTMPSGHKVTNGIGETPDGKPFTGRVKIKRGLIPQGTLAILKAAGVSLEEGSGQFSRPIDDFALEFENGQIVSITPEGGNKIDRTDMENFQLKYNTEPSKGQQLKFGSRGDKPAAAPKPTTKPKSDPLGIL